EGFGRSQLETLLPEYLPKQRWFGGKSRQIRASRIVDWGELAGSAGVVVMVEVQYSNGEPDTYLVPLAIAYGPDTERLRQDHPNAILAAVVSEEGRGLLYDAAFADPACSALLELVESGGRFETKLGAIRGVPGAVLPMLRGVPDQPLAVARTSAEQSNTSLI